MIKIRELRLENKQTQEELAKKLSISRQVLANYENEINKPDPDMLIKIANLYGISIDYLLGREDDFGNVNTNSDLSEREKKLLYLYNQLPETRQKTVLDTIEAMLEPFSVRSKA